MGTVPRAIHPGLEQTFERGVGGFEADHGISAYITWDVGAAFVMITFPATAILIGGGLFFRILENDSRLLFSKSPNPSLEFLLDCELIRTCDLDLDEKNEDIREGARK